MNRTMRVLVTGFSGQLGFDVCRELKRRGIAHMGISSRDLDITDEAAVRETILAYSPDAVIHCAAYTRVDQAQTDRARAFAVNAGGSRNIAAACSACGAKLAYLSTDYVFPGTGDRFWEVNDPTGPRNVYGESKLAGERAVLELLERSFLIRTSWVFGIHGSNFVKTMLHLAESRDSLRVVCDQVGSPTYTADLAPLLCDMVCTDRFGIYHATNEGICSWAEFAQEIFRCAGKRTAVFPVTTAAYGAKAPRPLNSRLSKASLDGGGFSRLPCWQDALRRYLEEWKAD